MSLLLLIIIILTIINVIIIILTLPDTCLCQDEQVVHCLAVGPLFFLRTVGGREGHEPLAQGGEEAL